MQAKRILLSWAMIALLTLSWVLLLLPSVTSGGGNNLTLANVIVDGDYQQFTASFGVIGAQADSPIRDSGFGDNPFDTGYWAVIRLPLEEPIPRSDTVRTVQGFYTVLYTSETEALIMFPVSLGLLGVAMIFFGAGVAKRKTGFQVLAAFLLITTMAVAWAAWGYAIALAPRIDDRLDRYRRNERSLWEVRIEQGNAIWPALVGVILLSIGTVIAIVALCLQPDEKRSDSGTEDTEMNPTKKSSTGESATRGSQSTLV